MSNRPAVIITGNVLDGFEIIGPFDDYDDAVRYAETEGDIFWNVADMALPKGADPDVRGHCRDLEEQHRELQEELRRTQGMCEILTGCLKAANDNKEDKSALSEVLRK